MDLRVCPSKPQSVTKLSYNEPMARPLHPLEVDAACAMTGSLMTWGPHQDESLQDLSLSPS